jgi:hypothetical protein
MTPTRPVEQSRSSSLRFAWAARRLGAEARQLHLETPSFRSPPRLPGAERTLRRRPDGGFVVAVRVRSRPFAVVAADMVDGVLAANGGVMGQARRHRAHLLRCLLEEDEALAA